MKFILIIISIIILESVAFCETPKSFEDLFHIDKKSAERLYGKSAYRRLKDAVDDYNAVIAGRPPIHAKFNKKHPLPADGGTSYYVGDGYELTVVKSLNGIKRGEKYFHGFMYGPVITFNEDLVSGNDPQISSVTFYPSEQLIKLLSNNERSKK